MYNLAAPLRILLIDDDADQFIITRDLLCEDKITNYKLDWVDCYEEGLTAITANQHDAYLLDYYLGNRTGLELLKEIANFDYAGPIIMLTGKEDHEIDLGALNAGAADFLVKGEVSTSLLSRSIRYAIEHKRSRDEIKRLNDGLEARVILRTTELLNQIKVRQTLEEELMVSLEKEKELSELKTRFITTISHEFRTPLTSVLASSELLEHYGKQWPEEKRLEVLRRIQDSAKKLSSLLDDILLVSKAQANRIEFKETPLDLVSYCQKLVEEVQVMAQTNTLIKFNYATMENDQVLADKTLLDLILTNLLNNALKYSRQGGTVDFQLCQEQEKIIFYIRDEGIGIPAEDQLHLFEPFYRAKNTGTIVGTGLGLTIVKRSAEVHGGNITVESYENKGTTVTVTLPIKHFDRVIHPN